MITKTATTASAGRSAGRGSSVAAASLLSLVFVGGTAGAYWTSAGVGFGSAATDTLGAPVNVTASPLAGTSDTLVIDWEAPASGAPVTGYRVNKDTASGALLCAVNAPTTTCNATGLLPSGTYDVIVTSLLHNSWTASAAAVSGSTNAPAATLNITDPAQNATGISITPTITGSSTTAGTINLAVRLGTATTGSTVAAGTATANGTSPWSGTVSPALANSTQYTVTATQTTPGGTSSVSRTFTTVAAAAPVSVATTTLPNATQNSAYSTQLAATGGTPPYTWAVSSGSLPAGLSFSSSGLLSGTPTATGSSTFSVIATDNANPKVSSQPQSLTLTVSPPADTTAPKVTINQAAAQADPTNGSTINFTVVFSETVTGFATGDVTLSGTAGATTATVTGGGASYNVAVSGMTGNGTVIATIAAGRATDGVNQSEASTSTDNTVTFDGTAPHATGLATTRAGTTLGVVSSGDVITFTYSEAVAPGSLISGWNGSGTQSITVTLDDRTGGDFLTFGTLNIGSLALGNTNYATSDSTASANVTLSGGVVTVTLTGNPPSATQGGNGSQRSTMTWTPSATATDLAGNATSTTPFVGGNNQNF